MAHNFKLIQCVIEEFYLAQIARSCHAVFLCWIYIKKVLEAFIESLTSSDGRWMQIEQRLIFYHVHEKNDV